MAKYKEGLVSSIELSQSGADYSQAQAEMPKLFIICLFQN